MSGHISPWFDIAPILGSGVAVGTGVGGIVQVAVGVIVGVSVNVGVSVARNLVILFGIGRNTKGSSFTAPSRDSVVLFPSADLSLSFGQVAIATMSEIKHRRPP
jgi:hypothetical protein